MPTIACLHVAFGTVPLFEAALERAQLPDGIDRVSMHHVVRPELLANVDLDATAREVLSLSTDADAVLVVCSTIGSAAEEVAPVISIPVARADRSLATAAVDAADPGGVVSVLYATDTTVGPTAQLFAEATVGRDVGFELIRVDGAWALFEAGDHRGYAERIAEVATAMPDGNVVALAQASMAPTAALVERPMLGVPAVAVDAILAEMARR